MGFIQLTSVTFSPTPTTDQYVTVRIKLASDPDVPASYTTVTTIAYVLTDGNFSPPVDITGLLDDTEYTVRVTPNCGGGSALKNFVTGDLVIPNLHWIADDSECETAGGFDVVKTITGLSSPYNTWYDTTLSRAFVADFDDPAGNVYWFNPFTATLASHMVHSTVVMQSELYANYIDTVYRRIYFSGRNSGGLIVYNVDTNTSSTVVFGTDGVAFNRTLLFVTEDRIYCNIGTSAGSTSIVIIDRATLTIINNKLVSTIPTPLHFSNGLFTFARAQNKLYVASNNGTLGTIGVYDLDLTTLIADITLPSSAVWDFGRYWQSIFYDVTGDQIYVGDIGSARRYVIDPNTDTVLDNTEATNRSGKSDAQHIWFTSPVTGELYCAVSFLNNSGDASPVKRMYLENRSTFTYEDMFENSYVTNVSGITGTNQLMGADPALTFWGGNPVYSTDGSITIFSTSIGTDNTGREIVLTLQEVDANNADLPTGNVKPNTLTDPDYISPIESSPNCPIVVNLNCPVDAVGSFAAGRLDYEFAIGNGVRDNPSVDNIAVYAYNTTLSLRDGAPQIINPVSDNYYSGFFTGLAGATYTFEVVYRDSSNIELDNCIIV